MYKLLVPIMNRTLNDKDRLDLVSELKSNAIDSILLVFNRVLCSDEKLSAEKEKFTYNKSFF